MKKSGLIFVLVTAVMATAQTPQYLPKSGGLLNGPLTSASYALGANESNTPWSGVFQSAASTPVTLLVLGDSISQGSGATPSNESGWANQLQLYGDLQRAFPGVTPNYYSNKGGMCMMMNGGNSSCSPSTTGTWTGVPGAIYQASPTLIYSIGKATASATACLPTYTTTWVDTVTLYYYTYTNSAAWTVTVDGSTVGTYGGGTTGSLTPAAAINVTLTPNGMGHTVCAVAPASGYLYLFGFNITAGTTGVRLWNASIPGAATSAYSYDTSWMTWLPSKVSALIALGQNDGWSSTAAITANLNTIVTALMAKNIPVGGIITEPPSGQTTAMDSVVNGVTQWYQLKGIPVVSIWNKWGTYTAGNTQGLYLDTIHPTTLGHTDIKTQVEGALLPGLGAAIATNSTPTLINMTPSTTMIWQGLIPIWKWSWPGVGSLQLQILGNGSSNLTASAGLQINTDGFSLYRADGTTQRLYQDANGNLTLYGTGPAPNLTLNSSYGTFTQQILGNGMTQLTSGGNGIAFVYSDGQKMSFTAGNLWVGTGGSYNTPAYLLTVGTGNSYGIDNSGNVHMTGYYSGATAGVTCTGTPTASFASILGIVTHC